MNYLYDILLNFNSKLFESFEWNVNDQITHIRKIPIFKVKSNILLDLLNNNVKLSTSFLSGIYKKTDYFIRNKICHINYAFVVTDGSEVIAFKSNNNMIISYSKLLFDEEYEALECSNNLKIEDLEYEIISKSDNEFFKTRNELYIKKFILNEINKMFKNNDDDKITYLYLECFNKNSKINIKKSFFTELEKNWDEVYPKIYAFLKNVILKH